MRTPETNSFPCDGSSAACEVVHMKEISVTLFLGVLLALPIIYYLRPLNSGAIGFVIFLCVGFVTVIVAGIKFMRKPEKKGGP